MSTVLVTGASGRLGQQLLARLQVTHRTRALVHRRPVEADEVVAGDVVTGRGLHEALEGVDAIVHLAAITHARRPSAYERVNVEGTRRVLAAAVNADVARFVHVSTRAIDPSGGAYSASKARAEELVRAAPLASVVLRLAEIYGAGGREGVDGIASSARAGRPVLVLGSGDHEICPIHVLDAVHAIAAAVDRSHVLGRTYTLGGECTTVRDFAAACVAAFGSRSPIVGVPEALVALAARAATVLPLPLAPDQPARLRAPKERPSTDAVAELGFHPRALADGLRALAANG